MNLEGIERHIAVVSSHDPGQSAELESWAARQRTQDVPAEREDYDRLHDEATAQLYSACLADRGSVLADAIWIGAASSRLWGGRDDDPTNDRRAFFSESYYRLLEISKQLPLHPATELVVAEAAVDLCDSNPASDLSSRNDSVRLAATELISLAYRLGRRGVAVAPDLTAEAYGNIAFVTREQRLTCTDNLYLAQHLAVLRIDLLGVLDGVLKHPRWGPFLFVARISSLADLAVAWAYTNRIQGVLYAVEQIEDLLARFQDAYRKLLELLLSEEGKDQSLPNESVREDWYPSRISDALFVAADACMVAQIPSKALALFRAAASFAPYDGAEADAKLLTAMSNRLLGASP